VSGSRTRRTAFRRTAFRLGSVWLSVGLLSGCASPGPNAVASAATNPDGIVAEVVSYQVVADRPGRLLVALFAADQRWLSFGSVGASFHFLGDAAASPDPAVTAPDAVASFRAIPGSPTGDGRAPSLTFPADGRGVYAVDPITLPRAGFWQVEVHAVLADGSEVEADAAFSVLDRPSIIAVGAAAPLTANPVLGEPGVAPSSIDSRALGSEPVPDPELHRTSIKDAVAAGHPALVVFSTPVYCVSRFCGPVTDLVSELAATYADRADFIHVEIYRDFQAGQVNQAALDWLSPASGDLREPWVFLIGADGRIAGSWDAVATRAEIEPLLRALPPK
jgi:hypothetical protein